MSLSEYSVIKREFNGNRSVPSNFMSVIEYSVITSDVIKSFDCIYGHSPPSTDSRRVVVSYKLKYAHEILVNHLIKPAQEKVWLGELTVST